MTETNWQRGVMKCAGVLLSVGLAGGMAVADGSRLGVAFEEREPGVLATEGREVADGELVGAVNRGVLVRLDHGQLLRLAANSALLLAGGPDHDVSITVLSGLVATVDERGRPQLGGQRSTFTLAPRTGDLATAESLLLALDLDASPRSRREEERRSGPDF